MNLKPNEVLHVGDDPERDWEAASAAGLSIFRLDRPKNSLRDLVDDFKIVPGQRFACAALSIGQRSVSPSTLRL